MKEGAHCFSPAAPNTSPDTCPDTGPRGDTLIAPILEYANGNVSGGLGRSVIGGYVYRGSALAGFHGRYIFGDWSQSFSQPLGSLFAASQPPGDSGPWSFEALRIAGRSKERPGEFVLAFGKDTVGELYLLTSKRAGPSGHTGTVYRIIPPE